MQQIIKLPVDYDLLAMKTKQEEQQFDYIELFIFPANNLELYFGSSFWDGNLNDNQARLLNNVPGRA